MKKNDRYEALYEVIQNKNSPNICTISEIDYTKKIRLSIVNSNTGELIKELKYTNQKNIENWIDRNHIPINA